jgi:hypothetical protein
MEDETSKIYHGAPKEGFYVYSSCGCGDDSAIRIEYVETPHDGAIFCLSPTKAKKLAHLIIEVAIAYENGMETGLD